MNSIRYFCVGHESPKVQSDINFTFITPTRTGYPGELVAPDLFLGPCFDGRILSEYTQLFWLAREIEAGRIITSEYVYILQYRKFISPLNGGRASKTVPFSRICSSDESRFLVPNFDSDLRGISRSFLGCFGPVLRLPRSFTENYSSYHVAEDFAGFVGSLSSDGLLNKQTLRSFINCQILIPSPSLSLIRAEKFVSHMKLLCRAWAAFYRDFYKERSGYQRRVGGFLLERLHSFLITSEINAGTSIKSYNYYTIVTDNNDISPTV